MENKIRFLTSSIEENLSPTLTEYSVSLSETYPAGIEKFSAVKIWLIVSGVILSVISAESRAFCLDSSNWVWVFSSSASLKESCIVAFVNSWESLSLALSNSSCCFFKVSRESIAFIPWLVLESNTSSDDIIFSKFTISSSTCVFSTVELEESVLSCFLKLFNFDLVSFRDVVVVVMYFSKSLLLEFVVFKIPDILSSWLILDWSWLLASNNCFICVLLCSSKVVFPFSISDLALSSLFCCLSKSEVTLDFNFLLSLSIFSLFNEISNCFWTNPILLTDATPFKRSNLGIISSFTYVETSSMFIPSTSTLNAITGIISGLSCISVVEPTPSSKESLIKSIFPFKSSMAVSILVSWLNSRIIRL